MRSNSFAITVTLALSASALGQAKVVITEIMYNPASTELKNETEWVEIANVGTEAIDIKDWHLDDEDKGTWGTFTCTLAPGGVAVLVNKDKMTEEEFRAAWDAPHETTEGSASAEIKTYQVIGVTWGGIANSPSAKNEIIQLLNEKDEVVCEVKQGRDFPKIKGNEGCSVHLINVMAANLSDGKVWKKSAVGTNGARTCKKTELFDGDDIGSPGTIITAPQSVPAMPILPPEEPAAAPAKDKKPDAPKEKPADAAPAPAATPAAPAAPAPEKPKTDPKVPY